MRYWHMMILAAAVAMGSAACSQSEEKEANSAPAGNSAMAVAPTQDKTVKPEPVAKAEQAVEESVAKVEEKVEQAGTAVATSEPVQKVEEAAKTVEEGAAAAAATATAAMSQGDVAKGEKITKSKCAACHFLDKDRNKVGPTLVGIYGKKPTIDGVPYATWDDAALDAWIEKPRDVKPKTKMAFAGISDAKARQDMIAYLKTL